MQSEAQQDYESAEFPGFLPHRNGQVVEGRCFYAFPSPKVSHRASDSHSALRHPKRMQILHTSSTSLERQDHELKGAEENQAIVSDLSNENGPWPSTCLSKPYAYARNCDEKNNEVRQRARLV